MKLPIIGGITQAEGVALGAFITSGDTCTAVPDLNLGIHGVLLGNGAPSPVLHACMLCSLATGGHPVHRMRWGPTSPPALTTSCPHHHTARITACSAAPCGSAAAGCAAASRRGDARSRRGWLRQPPSRRRSQRRRCSAIAERHAKTARGRPGEHAPRPSAAVPRQAESCLRRPVPARSSRCPSRLHARAESATRYPVSRNTVTALARRDPGCIGAAAVGDRDAATALHKLYLRYYWSNLSTVTPNLATRLPDM